MKLIIDIPEERLDSIKHFGIKQNEVSMLERALISGTPLDDVKTEIEKIYQEIDTVSHNEYENAVEQGKETAYENVLSILDNIGKAESEDKE